jgi:hypothetical protein
VAKRWTVEEKSLVLRSYNGKNVKDLSKILGRSVGNIQAFASNNHITVQTKWSAEEDRLLLDNPHLTAQQLCNIIPKRTKISIKHRRKDLGMLFEHRGNRKYQLNHNYFSVPNLENSYWAGFIAADGNINDKQGVLRVQLSNADSEHLLKLKKSLGYTGPLRPFSYIGFGKEAHASLLQVSSSKIVTDLRENFEIIPKKTFTLEPPKLKNNLLDAYIIGYIDGDGSIMHRVEALTISVTGNYQMLLKIKDRFDEICRPTNTRVANVHKNKSVFYYAISGKRASFIYKHFAGIDVPKLDRKWFK